MRKLFRRIIEWLNKPVEEEDERAYDEDAEYVDIKGYEAIVNGESVPVKGREFVRACITSAEAGTNGFYGGDSGHGSRTFIRISALASTYWSCSVESGGVLNDFFCPKEITIAFGGDQELKNAIDMFYYIADTLSEQAGQ